MRLIEPADETIWPILSARIAKERPTDEGRRAAFMDNRRAVEQILAGHGSHDILSLE